jgi:hypothetical protein
VTIPEPMLRRAIERLEDYATHPDTGAIHDPIYALIGGAGEEAEAALVVALQVRVGHPLAAELCALFAPHLEVGEPDLVDVLSRHAPVSDGTDPIAEVDRRLSDGQSRDRIQRVRIRDLERHLETMSRTANGLAAAGAIVGVFGAIGWLIALGWLEIAWIDAPTPDDPAAAASGQGAVPAGERKIR